MRRECARASSRTRHPRWRRVPRAVSAEGRCVTHPAARRDQPDGWGQGCSEPRQAKQRNNFDAAFMLVRPSWASGTAKGLWRGAGERFFLGSGQSQLLKQITTTASFFRPPMAASAIFDLLRPSTRNSRGYTQLNGQTPSGSHTAAHRLAQASIAAQASPKRSASMA